MVLTHDHLSFHIFKQPYTTMYGSYLSGQLHQEDKIV